ncbi:MAG: hypothetical protein LIP28_08295 [Deltaproteobacteria bacterium]|nr:hypothetical protein [Deltaproteobacteria bacterium]
MNDNTATGWRRLLREREAAGDCEVRSRLLDMLVERGGMDPRFAWRVLEGEKVNSAVLDSILADAIASEEKPSPAIRRTRGAALTQAEIEFLYRH